MAILHFALAQFDFPLGVIVRSAERVREFTESVLAQILDVVATTRPHPASGHLPPQAGEGKAGARGYLSPRSGEGKAGAHGRSSPQVREGKAGAQEA